jgi:hypothetical protein
MRDDETGDRHERNAVNPHRDPRQRKPQTIYPHQPLDYSISGNTAKFRIATQNRGFVEYKVVAAGRYTLGWDQNKGVWDFRTSLRGV